MTITSALVIAAGLVWFAAVLLAGRAARTGTVRDYHRCWTLSCASTSLLAAALWTATTW